MLQTAFVTSGMLHAQFRSVHIVFSEPRLQCSCMMQSGERCHKHLGFCSVWLVLSTFAWIGVIRLEHAGLTSRASTFIH